VSGAPFFAAAAAMAFAAITAAHGAPADDCEGEAALLARAETELPRLDLTPPLHHQLVCISLETLAEFRRRVGAHVRRCPASPYAAKAAGWAGEDYGAQFRRHRCRRKL